jgi:hypothetical protein
MNDILAKIQEVAVIPGRRGEREGDNGTIRQRLGE